MLHDTVLADEFDFDEVPLIARSSTLGGHTIDMEQTSWSEDQYLVGENRRRSSLFGSLRCGCCCSCCRKCCKRVCCWEKELKSRTIKIGYPPVGQKFPANKVKNQKYNIITFIPLVLFQQFRFFLNLYFLVMALSQFIPEIRIGYLSTYWGPLGFVLTVTLCREAYDDFSRYLRDKEMNSAKYEKLTPHGPSIIPSSNIHVGDVVRVKKDQRVPADMILLRTTEKTGACFLRTDQLDGETDWKLRIAVPATQHVDSDSDIFGIESSLFAEKPQKDIHGFLGTFKGINNDGSKHEDPLNVENTMWADTVVASGNALGLVVYTGKETRAAMNASQPQSKVGLLDLELNNLTKILCAVVIGLAFVMVLMKGFSGPWYRYFFRFILLFSYIIPISLRVNLDMAKTTFARLIGWDKNIPGTIVRSSTIPEELGRIGYLLSDKTGTLTRNQMVFKKLHLGSVSFSPDTFDEIRENLKNAYSGGAKASFSRHSVTSKIQQAVEAVSLCHNVTPVYEQDDDSVDMDATEVDQQLNQVISYQASSPDEIALVSWTEEVGLTLTHRQLSSMGLRLPDGSSRTYDILQLFPFTSESKRMGIIVKEQETGVIKFFLKGADAVVKNLVQYNDWLEEECTNMAREGLRTLVVARKILTEQQYADFEKQYQAARVAMTDRSGRIAAVVSRLEQDMQLLCLTGVEDTLQEDVRTTLEQMTNAGIKVWMLTGDKLETAVCIAKSSRLVSKTQNLHVFRSVLNRSEAHAELSALRRKIDAALVITGDSLKICIENYEEEFAELACGCPAVVCCRCSPEQKTQIVQMLRRYLPGKRIAAVGDGGNDVGMIQAAHAGIGIVGKEGRQASLAADFSITQFSFLSRLLLIHGRFCYKRSCALGQFVMHRGLIISTMQAIFSCVFYFASVSLYQGPLMVAYSTIYTMFPVFSLVMDKDVKESIALTYPELYKELAKGRSLSYKTFFIWFLASVYQGAAIMYGALLLFESDFIHIVSISFTALIITELVMVGLTVHIWHWSMIVSEIFSVSIYIASIFIFHQYFDVDFVKTPDFWWKTVVITAISCVPLYIFKFLQKKIAPPSYAKLS